MELERKGVSMNEKLDALLSKLSSLAEAWLDEFAANPVRTAIKVLLLLAVIKYARKALR